MKLGRIFLGLIGLPLAAMSAMFYLPYLFRLSTAAMPFNGSQLTPLAGGLTLMAIAWIAEDDLFSRWLRAFGLVICAGIGASILSAQPGEAFVKGHIAPLVVLIVIAAITALVPYRQYPTMLWQVTNGICHILNSLLARKVVKGVAIACMAAWVMFMLLALPMEFFLRTDYSFTKVFGKFTDDYPRHMRQNLNSLKFRDVERSAEKQAGKLRLLALGDSITFGRGVAVEDAWPQQLQKLLGDKVEVINMARCGWSTADELACLDRDGLQFSPDAVLVGFCTNDPEPPSGQPDGLSRERKLFTLLLAKSACCRLLDCSLNRAIEAMKVKGDYGSWEDKLYVEDGPYWPRWRECVGALAAKLKDSKIKAFVAPLPCQAPKDREPVQQGKVEKAMKVYAEAGFTVCDTMPAYRTLADQAAPLSLWALPNDGHPSPALHKLYAVEIARQLQPWLAEAAKAEKK